MKKSLCLLLAVCLFGLIAFRLWNSREDDGPIPVVIDADPGIDDAFALMAAAASDRLEILGITTVHGNVSLAKTSISALKLACWLGIDCPVAIGAELCAGLQYLRCDLRPWGQRSWQCFAARTDPGI